MQCRTDPPAGRKPKALQNQLCCWALCLSPAGPASKRVVVSRSGRGKEGWGCTICWPGRLTNQLATAIVFTALLTSLCYHQGHPPSCTQQLRAVQGKAKKQHHASYWWHLSGSDWIYLTSEYASTSPFNPQAFKTDSIFQTGKAASTAGPKDRNSPSGEPPAGLNHTTLQCQHPYHIPKESRQASSASGLSQKNGVCAPELGMFGTARARRDMDPCAATEPSTQVRPAASELGIMEVYFNSRRA